MAAVKLATLNIFNRMGEWGWRAPLLIDQLEALRPDVLALQEVDLALDQGMWICRAINKRLPREERYLIKHAANPGPRASFHSIATISRLEFISHEILDLMSHDRVAQRFVFHPGERAFVFANTHLHHPPEAQQERVEQVERILGWLDRDCRGVPTVIAGDFNSYAEPPEPAARLMKSRFRSTYEVVHGREPEKTWPTPVNTFDDSPPGTLDYIFVSDELEVLDAGLAFDQPAPYNERLYPSDHLGLYAVVELG